MWKNILLIAIVLLILYWVTLPSEKYSCCGPDDTLESVLHGDLSSRQCENKLRYTMPKNTDLKAPLSCFESNQMRALIDSSNTQGTVCEIMPNCSRYMWAGDLTHRLGMP